MLAARATSPLRLVAPPLLALTAALLLALALSPVAAHAAFGPPTSATIRDDEYPVALAIAATGRAAVVVQRALFPDQGRTALIRLPSGQRRSLGAGSVIAQAARADGGVDLVVRRGDAFARGDIVLRRVLPSGRVLDLWSVRTTAMRAALVRTARRTIVVWPEGSAVRFVSRPDGGIPTRPRIARLQLSGAEDVDAVLDRGGRLVLGVSGTRGVVLASVSLNGRVRHRQSTPNAAGTPGDVSLAQDADGRIAALIYESGVALGDSECISEGRTPSVRAALRAADAQRFEPVRTLATPPFSCLGGGALLRTVNARFFSVIFQTAGDSPLPGLVRQSVAGPRAARFLETADLAPDADLYDAIALRRSGSLLMALRARPSGAAQVPAALSVRTHPSRVVQELAPASAAPATPQLALDAAGHPVIAWTEGTALKVARDPGA